MGKQVVLKRVLSFVVLAGILATMTGCGAISQLLWVIKGHDTPAPYPGLEEQRVAVVCVSDASAYGPDTLTNTVNKVVGLKLATYGDEIEVIPPGKIQEWVDVNGWDETNLGELGQAVGATKVLSIEIGEYTIHEGKTIFKGRADITVNVYDVATGKVENVLGPENYQFPEYGRPATQTTERKFEAVYLAKLTQYISRQFYKHDKMDDVAQDASMMY